MTSSPSMDILISSNLERLIYWITGNHAKQNSELMQSLSKEGKYEITKKMKEQLSDFYGNYTTEKQTEQVIHELYQKTGYVLDTHTAVAAGVYAKYREETRDTAKTVIVSTASPFKFTRSVMNSIEDFLNLHNGLFNVNVSNEKSIELELEPPVSLQNTYISSSTEMILMPIIYPFGTLNFFFKI